MQITRKILATMSWKPETFPAIKLLNFNFGMLIDVKLTLRSHSFPLSLNYMINTSSLASHSASPTRFFKLEWKYYESA